jgi:hypothetical protein
VPPSLVFAWELLTTTRVSGDKSGEENLRIIELSTSHKRQPADELKTPPDGSNACKLRELPLSVE